MPPSSNARSQLRRHAGSNADQRQWQDLRRSSTTRSTAGLQRFGDQRHRPWRWPPVVLVLLHDCHHRCRQARVPGPHRSYRRRIAGAPEPALDGLPQKPRRRLLHATQVVELALGLPIPTRPSKRVVHQEAHSRQPQWGSSVPRGVWTGAACGSSTAAIFPEAIRTLMCGQRITRARPRFDVPPRRVRRRSVCGPPHRGDHAPVDQRRTRLQTARDTRIACAGHERGRLLIGVGRRQLESRGSSMRPCQRRTRARVASARPRSSPSRTPVTIVARHNDSAAVNCPASVRAAACQMRALSEAPSALTDCA